MTDLDALVERLRRFHKDDDVLVAADAIEALRSRLEAAEKAFELIANMTDSEMRDGDGARDIAKAALAGPVQGGANEPS